jgi:hypothetical protein
MKHIGWFVWWTYEKTDTRPLEFYPKIMEEIIDTNGEGYVRGIVEEMLKRGEKCGYKISAVGYKKAYVEN